MEHNNQFNFSHLVSLYADKTALIIGPDSYTYQQLGTMKNIKILLKKF